jgi:hypothetical protein
MNEHRLDNGTLTVPRDDIAGQGDCGGVTCVAKLIAALPERDAFDLAVTQDLEQRRVMLSKHASRRPDDDLPLGDCGWTHGDFQYRNLMWSGGRLSAILDWDRIGVRALVEEVVRTAAVQFVHDDGMMDVRRIGAFTATYRSVLPLKDEHLIDAGYRLWPRLGAHATRPRCRTPSARVGVGRHGYAPRCSVNSGSFSLTRRVL